MLTIPRNGGVDMQTQTFDHAFIKIWFVGAHASRNLTGVKSIEKRGNTLVITNDSNTKYVVNYDNVTMIEEIHDGID